MKIALATLYTAEIEEFGRITAEEKGDYCCPPE